MIEDLGGNSRLHMSNAFSARAETSRKKSHLGLFAALVIATVLGYYLYTLYNMFNQAIHTP
jgi:cytochrome c-type biogenesis protein CcmH/NrfG